MSSAVVELAAVSLALVKLAADCFLAARATLTIDITFSLVVLAAVILVLGSVSKAASGVDGEAERTIHLPEKNSRQFGELMLFALSQRNNSLALSRNGRRTRSTPRSG